MNQLVTDAIVLMRTNYGEADRIIKLLTPEAGKISLLARGVRKPKSKLAGGIELFSISSLTYIKGRGDLGTLVSARLDTHYGVIVRHIDRVQLGYELIKLIDRATEDEPGAEYFALLQTIFVALNDPTIDTDLIRLWCHAQLLQLAGYTPNTASNLNGEPLTEQERYSFDFDSASFNDNPQGSFTVHHIKFLRLILAGHPPQVLQQVMNGRSMWPALITLLQTMLTSYIRV